MMKYEIGATVILKNEKSVYITDYNNKTKQYKGIDAENKTPDEILFRESDVLMTV